MPFCIAFQVLGQTVQSVELLADNRIVKKKQKLFQISNAMSSDDADRKRTMSQTAHKTNSVPTSTLSHIPLEQQAVSVSSLPPNSYTLRQTSQLDALLTIVRSVPYIYARVIRVHPAHTRLVALYRIVLPCSDRNTKRGEFIFYSDRIIRLLVEESLNHLPVVPKTVQTPTGADYDGVAFQGKIAGVSSKFALLRPSHPSLLGK